MRWWWTEAPPPTSPTWTSSWTDTSSPLCRETVSKHVICLPQQQQNWATFIPVAFGWDLARNCFFLDVIKPARRCVFSSWDTGISKRIRAATPCVLTLCLWRLHERQDIRGTLKKSFSPKLRLFISWKQHVITSQTKPRFSHCSFKVRHRYFR